MPHDQRRPTLSVDLIIEENNRILLGKLTEKWTDGGKYIYGLPGTEIKFGETIGNTVKRSIDKELGCEVKTYKIVGVNANYIMDNHYVSIAVVVEIKGEPVVRQNEDWQAWEWFEINSLPEKLFVSAQNAINSYHTKTFTVSE